jgi:hypothetical protein
MAFPQVPPNTPCKNCGHRFDVHAPDINYPVALRCFHNAGSGEGCAAKYSDCCKNFVYPSEDE